MKLDIKKVAAAGLAALMLVSADACGNITDGSASGAAAVSSSAETAAEWLNDRIGVEAAGEVTVGVAGDAVKYGVSLDGLRDDGYVIRKENGEALIFGATEDGLDRGVRYYARNFAGTDSANYTYGEGPRVKRLTIAGNDISEYTIVLAAGSDECHRYAASELRKYIGDACGYYPEIASEKSGRAIILEQVKADDPRYGTLGDEGFTIAVTDGDLVISGGELRGCLFGVYELLESYVGYVFLYDYEKSGDSDSDTYYLYESSHVDIPEGVDDTQIPSFTLRDNYNYNGSEFYTSDDYVVKMKCIPDNVVTSKYNTYRIMWSGNHGMRAPVAAGYIPGFDASTPESIQPCFSDQEVIDGAIAYYLNYIKGKLESGSVIGWDLTDIDVGQLDCDQFCMCGECMEKFSIDGGYIGPYLNFVNTVADAVNEEYHDENGDPVLWVKFLAYGGANTVPKVTRPRDNVVPNYCFYQNPMNYLCYSHPISGAECTGTVRKNLKNELSNKRFGEEFEGWCSISKRVEVWYYPGMWEWSALPAPMTRNLREDFAYINSFDNVYGVFVCPGNYPQTDDKLVMYLLYRLMWNADMSDAEYQDYIKEYLYIMCGDGYEYLYEYMGIQESFTKNDCWTVMGWTDPSERIQFDKAAVNFEQSINLYEMAERLADSAAREEYVKKLSRTMYLTGLVASHSDMYLNGSDAERERYAEIYNYFKSLALDTGFFLSNPESPMSEEMFDIEHNLAEYFDFNMAPGASERWWE